jgi:tetratricopeptide (TPR) repeat protein
VLLQYGRWLARTGREEEGIALMKQATLIDLGYTDAHRALGEAYLRTGQMKEAFEHLQRADVQIPGHPYTQRALERARRAMAASASERLAEARRAVAENPDNLQALFRLADELAGVGDHPAAVDRLIQAEPRFADVAAFHNRLAVALVMAKRTDDAVARYRRALELQPDSAPRLVPLGTLLMDRRGKGDLAEARRLIGKAHRLAPDRLEVRLARAELLALEGRRAEAAELYRAVAADLPEGSDYKRACELKAETLGH